MRLVPRPRLSWVSAIEEPESGFKGFGVKLGRQRVAGGPFLFKETQVQGRNRPEHLRLKPTPSTQVYPYRGLSVIVVSSHAKPLPTFQNQWNGQRSDHRKTETPKAPLQFHLGVPGQPFDCHHEQRNYEHVHH